MSKPLLLDLYNHTLEVRVWNSKSKLSARARYDRPKAFRLPAPTTKRSTLSDSDEQEREGEANRPPLVRRPSKLPVVSHDRVRGGAYKASRRLKQVCNVQFFLSYSRFAMQNYVRPSIHVHVGVYFQSSGGIVLTECR